MAILFLAGRPGVAFITGLSTDTKPSPTNGLTFRETDTDKLYKADGASWNLVLNDQYATSAQGAKADSALQSIADGSITLAKQANMATASLVYRKTAGSGVPEVNTLATLKTDLTLVKGDVGLNSVDNTSDAGKPVSTAQQTALNLKANLASPTFTGTVAGISATMVGLGSVENTALSTWAGSANIVTVGTVGTGTWNANAIADGKIAAALTGKSYAGSTVTMTGAITSSGGGIGYATGAGGTITQLTSRVTGVTLSKLSGTITMFSSAILAAASSTFVLTNTFIAATDIVLAYHNSTTNACSWAIETIAAAGTCTFVVKNISAASITEATPIKFIVIKAVNA
jgi:hypothetical protein